MSNITVFETENTKVTCYDSQHPRLIISFDNRRKDRTGFPPANPSRFFAANNMAFITIYVANNDWFLNDDLPDLRATLSQFTLRFEHITSIGYSMGGYGALLLSRESRANQIVLVSPQSSIFASRAPFETRYLSEASQLNPDLDTMAKRPRKGLRGVLLFDPTHKIDSQHKDIICNLHPKIRPVPLPFGGHPAMAAIGQAKLYSGVQKELLRKRFRVSEILRLHKQARRRAPAYQEGLNRYLAKRNLR